MWILNFEHLEHSFADFAPSICASKDQNRYFCQKYHGRTDRPRQTDTIHTSLSLSLSVDREHNSPSGKQLTKGLLWYTLNS